MIRFHTPWLLLWIVPLLGIVWWWRPAGVPTSWRQHVVTFCRMTTMSLLVMALALPVLMLPPVASGVVVVRDVSDSIDATARRQQDAIIAQLQRTQPASALLGIVDVATDAAVAALPQPSLRDTSATLRGATNATALADAVLLAASLIPGEYAPRVVVLSDGNETRGRLHDIIDLLVTRQVVVDVVPLARTVAPPVVALTAVQLPQRVRGSGDVAMTLLIDSAFAQTSTIRITDDATTLVQIPVELRAGTQQIVVTLPTLAPGLHRLDVVVAADRDDQQDDNRRTVLVERVGPPRMLVLADPLSRAETLVDAWRRMGVDVTLARPRDISTVLTTVVSYDVIVLVDTPARLVPVPVMTQIATSVSTFGKGFLWVGGADSFAAGGYRRTPLADIAAVALEPRDPTQRKRLDLLLVIDKSGSMAESATALSKLDLAKEAAFRAIRNLQSDDTVGVAFFADTAQWILPPQPLPSDEVVAQALGRVTSDGGTSIRAGLQLALTAYPQLTGDVHHVILLSDGIDTQSSDALARELWRNQVSLSTIALGADADVATLRRLAELGNGTAYQVSDPQTLVDVFLDDTTQVASRDIVEAEVIPQKSANDAWLAPLQRVVPIYGYNRTAVRDQSRVLLQIDPTTPLWVLRPVGRGHSAAWTSDLGNRWGRAWVAQDMVTTLAPLLITPLLPANNNTLDMAWFWHDDILDVDVSSPLTTPAPTVTLIARTGAQIDVPVVARGVAHWSGRIRDMGSGEYILMVTQDGTVVSRGVMLDSRAEMHSGGGTAILTDVAQRTGGRILSQVDDTFWVQPTADFVVSHDITLWFLLAALSCFAGEISLRRAGQLASRWQMRRLQFSRSAPPAQVVEAPTPTPPPQSAARIDRLRAAKERSRRRDDLAE